MNILTKLEFESHLSKIKVVWGPFASLALQRNAQNLLVLGGGSGSNTQGLEVDINFACPAPISPSGDSTLVSPQGGRPLPEEAKEG